MGKSSLIPIVEQKHAVRIEYLLNHTRLRKILYSIIYTDEKTETFIK